MLCSWSVPPHQVSSRFAVIHWDRVLCICVSTRTILGSDNGLWPEPIWNILNWKLTNKLQCNFNRHFNIFPKIMYLKMSSAKWRPFCLVLNVFNETELKVIQISWTSIRYNTNGDDLLGIWLLPHSPPRHTWDRLSTYTFVTHRIQTCVMYGFGEAEYMYYRGRIFVVWFVDMWIQVSIGFIWGCVGNLERICLFIVLDVKLRCNTFLRDGRPLFL